MRFSCRRHRRHQHPQRTPSHLPSRRLALAIQRRDDRHLLRRRSRRSRVCASPVGSASRTRVRAPPRERVAHRLRGSFHRSLQKGTLPHPPGWLPPGRGAPDQSDLCFLRSRSGDSRRQATPPILLRAVCTPALKMREAGGVVAERTRARQARAGPCKAQASVLQGRRRSHSPWTRRKQRSLQNAYQGVCHSEAAWRAGSIDTLAAACQRKVLDLH
mmetsp:Transcript_7353/g.27939  ORF Transcript_7353/g.27939 Transcript_7353/m.27939 type:complete len:216 (-) Transcript_7353:820-1467(-)